MNYKISKEIFILGVGRYTPVIAEHCEICGFKVIGYYHFNNDRNGEIYLGEPIISATSKLFENDLSGKNFALSMGDNFIRENLFKKILSCGGKLPNLIHPTVEISKSAILSSSGIILKRNVSIQAGAKIEANTIICNNSTVCHNACIKENCFAGVSSIIGAYTNVSRNVMIGQGAVIVSGKVEEIGENSIIGAGSVVVNNVSSNSIVAGNPAKLIRKNN